MLPEKLGDRQKYRRLAMPEVASLALRRAMLVGKRLTYGDLAHIVALVQMVAAVAGACHVPASRDGNNCHRKALWSWPSS